MQRIFFTAVLISFLSLSVSAHPGRTDSRGGHYNRKTGTYHYHNGGSSSSSSSVSTKSSKTKTPAAKPTTTNSYKALTMTTISVDSVRMVQNKLNSLGYDCGVADGVMGNKTKQALQSFQKSNDLVVDGKINAATKKALGL